MDMRLNEKLTSELCLVYMVVLFLRMCWRNSHADTMALQLLVELAEQEVP